MSAARTTTVTAATEAIRTRLQADRLARWSAIAAVPVLWLAVALANPWLLLLAPLAVALLAALFRYGPAQRYEQPDDLF